MGGAVIPSAQVRDSLFVSFISRRDAGYEPRLQKGRGCWRVKGEKRTYGTQGTPALIIISLLSLFDPILLIASAGGPINTNPASLTLAAKVVDSDMKPYPG